MYSRREVVTGVCREMTELNRQELPVNVVISVVWC
nr:MAG TPA: hypothetical protein [Caudoviricetes sp.]